MGMAMKKKILFMLINMNVGGTEKALLNMIREMPRDQFEITIFMLEEYGGFLDSIPKDVKVQYLQGFDQLKGMLSKPLHVIALELLKKGKIMKALLYTYLYIDSKLKKENILFYKYLLRNYPVERNEYDIAIAYAGPMDFISYFIVHKVKAKEKLQWIHFDVTKIGFNKYFAAKMYKQMDKIFAVSKVGKEKLAAILPELNKKLDVYTNKVTKELVMSMAESNLGFEDGFTGIRILTVGRLSKEKGQDLAIHVLAKLRSQGGNVRWYCIGDGPARREYERLIEAYQLEDDFVLLGSHSNPYPFMKQCDIYVQPSRHEGYCITLAEVKCFDHPIISTNFTGASEQLDNRKDSMIVDVDEEQLFYAILNVLNNEKMGLKTGETNKILKFAESSVQVKDMQTSCRKGVAFK